MKIHRLKKGNLRRSPVSKRGTARKDRPGVKTRVLMVRSWWVLRGIAAGTLALAFLYAAYLGAEKVVAFPALSVKKVIVEGCRGIDSKIVIRMSGVTIGQPLLQVDLIEVRERVVRHPVVRDATVVRELPDTLRITIQERMPSAAVMNGDFALVDMDGVVLANPAVYTADYPVITGVGSIPEAGQVALEALPALQAMKDLILSGFLGTDRISELRATDERLLVSLTGSGTLLVLPLENVQAGLLRLGHLMEAGFFDARAPGYDLRFQGRVIVMPERTVSGEQSRSTFLAGG